MAGPLTALYRQFIQAADGAFGVTASRWTEFPTPSFSMLLSSLLLAALPAFVLALICLGASITRRRADVCVEAIRKEHERMLKERTTKKELHIEINDLQINAARRLLTRIPSVSGRQSTEE